MSFNSKFGVLSVQQNLVVMVMVALTLATLGSGCDGSSEERAIASTNTSSTISSATADRKDRIVVVCKTPEEFSKRTGISAIETILHNPSDGEFNDNSKEQFRYTGNETLVSARALAENGRSLELPHPNGESGSADEFCSTYDFLLAGNFGFITHVLGYGAGPYPAAEQWAIHIPTFKLIEDVGIKHHGFLVQMGSNCLGSSLKGDSGNPHQVDRWCAVEDGERFKWVSRVMILDDANREAKIKAGELGITEYYSFTCDRSSGIGRASDKQHAIKLGHYEAVANPEISARMDKECELWATQ